MAIRDHRIVLGFRDHGRGPLAARPSHRVDRTYDLIGNRLLDATHGAPGEAMCDSLAGAC